MLFVPIPADLDVELSNGLWSRSELLEMDARFCEALERAFANGLESRASAAATVRVGRLSAVDAERVIEAAWVWFRDAKFEATAVEVVARCSGIASERVREGIKRRLTSWIGEVR